jgi:hypothetical protein
MNKNLEIKKIRNKNSGQDTRSTIQNKLLKKTGYLA